MSRRNTKPAKPAPPDADLAARILAHIANANSKQPADSRDVLALVGGPEPEFWLAFERLKREARINCAVIKRAGDTAEWLGIWPTGMPARHDSWKDLNARGHFSTPRPPPTPQRLPQSPAQRRQIEDTTVHIETPPCASRQDRIAELVRGRPIVNGLTMAEIASDLGISPEGVRHLVKSMATGDRVAVAKRPHELAHCVYDPTAQAEATPTLDAEPTEATLMAVADALDQLDLASGAHSPRVSSAGPADEPCGNCQACASIAIDLAAIADALGEMEPVDYVDLSAADQLDTSPQRPTFALWDDGSLSIYDGDELLQIAPADVARLARLLGVPRACEVAA